MLSGKRAPLLAAALLALATTLAYLTSFRGALVFDDLPGIAHNPTIRDLRRLDLLPVAIGPQGGTLAGRPLPNLTLALNYAISGDRLWSYHAFNLLVHLLAGLTLFGLVRRTLLRSPIPRSPSSELRAQHSTSLAFFVALLWLLHPLQTEAVTYLVQRVESLMALFFLLTLYCFVRSLDSSRPRRWEIAAFLACLAGMACKEVMAAAPLLVLLYDRTFVAHSWRETWRQRGRFHLALLGTWLVLGALVVASGGRGGTAGFGIASSPWRYALTQCRVILDYLKLALWPSPLVFDHNVPLAPDLAAVWPQALALLAALGASGWLLARRPAAGFLCAWFFLILAPTSSIVPIADAMVEHRLYLPLAAVIAGVVLALASRFPRATSPALLAVALVLGLLTARRNLDYRSPLALWQDVVRQAPENPRGHNNLGAYLLEAGRLDEARAQFTAALQLDPHYASAHYNLGKLLEQTGRDAEAAAAYESALHSDPKRADAHVNLGRVLDRLGRPADAVPHYEAALRLDPDAPDTHAFLGAAFVKLKQPAPALVQLQAALELEPDRAETWCDVARARQLQGDLSAAREACARALRLRPDFPLALYVLGNLDAAAQDFPSAIAHFRRAVELAPDYAAARNNLANALLLAGRAAEAVEQYRLILRDRPDDRAVQENLARALELARP
ncbi:MAG TPA: tetratricopeptide repeat protein [Opitutaceae bacterium]|nr:tetratricopeptide repeat protein [Opitutaceae bacterium]